MQINQIPKQGPFFGKFTAHLLLPGVLCVVTLVSLFSRMRAGIGAIAFYDDDFFYYLQVAKHLASGAGSTFDGIHRTNGYHPLWLLLLTALSWLLPVNGVLFAVLVLIFLSTLVTYFLARRCFLFRTDDALLASLAATGVAFSALFLTRGGMEIVLTIPLALLLCWFRSRDGWAWTTGNAVVYGLLAAATILSRLDSVLLIALLLAFELIAVVQRTERARYLPLLVTALTAAVPVGVYVLINLHFFHTAFPVSSQAKQLRIHHTLSIAPLKSLFFDFTIYARCIVVAPALILIGAALYRLITVGWDRCVPRRRPLTFALLLFPFVHLLALSVLSDWQLWQWYLYALLLGEVGACLVLLRPQTVPAHVAVRGRTLEFAAVAALLLVMSGYAAGRLRSSTHPNGSIYEMYDAGTFIAAFAHTHPGIYAMGDRSGIPSFLLGQPLIQIEGLVMDAAYLRNIRTERDLPKVLADYHVSYYVATNPLLEDGCYVVREPFQAGRDSHAMRGSFCQKPIASMRVHDTDTLIFDVRGASTQALVGLPAATVAHPKWLR